MLPGVEELLALVAVRRAAAVRPVGRRRRRLRADRRDAAAAGPARGRRRLPGAAVPGPPAGRARAAGRRDAAPARRRRWDRTADALDGLAERARRPARAARRRRRPAIRLVLTPERVVAAETRRTLTALALHGLRVDGLVANRMVPVPPAGRAGGPAAALAAGARGRAGGGARRAGRGSALPLRTVGHRAAEPTGVAALLELAARPVGRRRPGGRRPAATGTRCWRVRRTAGDGRSPDSEFELALHLPGAGAGAAGPGPGRRRAGRDRGRACAGWSRCPPCCAAARSPGPARGRRSAGGVPAGPGAVAAVTWTRWRGGERAPRHVAEPPHGAARRPLVEELRALALLALDRLDPLAGPPARRRCRRAGRTPGRTRSTAARRARSARRCADAARATSCRRTWPRWRGTLREGCSPRLRASSRQEGTGGDGADARPRIPRRDAATGSSSADPGRARVSAAIREPSC